MCHSIVSRCFVLHVLEFEVFRETYTRIFKINHYFIPKTLRKALPENFEKIVSVGVKALTLKTPTFVIGHVHFTVINQ